MFCGSEFQPRVFGLGLSSGEKVVGSVYGPAKVVDTRQAKSSQEPKEPETPEHKSYGKFRH